jgi:hypothetical protein
MAKAAKPKAKMGRPTKYEPIFCEMLIDHMSRGYSYESFAGKISTVRATLYNWEQIHSDFLDAKNVGVEKNLLFWEEQGIEGMHNQTIKDEDGMVVTKSINATVWIFNMKNRHKWRDKSEAEIAEEKDRPLRELSDEELVALAAKEGK